MMSSAWDGVLRASHHLRHVTREVDANQGLGTGNAPALLHELHVQVFWPWTTPGTSNSNGSACAHAKVQSRYS